MVSPIQGRLPAIDQRGWAVLSPMFQKPRAPQLASGRRLGDLSGFTVDRQIDVITNTPAEGANGVLDRRQIFAHGIRSSPKRDQA